MKKKNNVTFNNVEFFGMVDKLAEIFEDMPPIKLEINPTFDTIGVGWSDDSIDVTIPVKNAYTLDDAFDMIDMIHSTWNPLQLDYYEDLEKYDMNHKAFANVALWALTDYKLDIKFVSKESEELYQKYYKSYEEKVFKHIEEKYGYTVIRE